MFVKWEVQIFPCWRENRMVVMSEFDECFCKESETGKKSECLGNDSKTETQGSGHVLRLGVCNFREKMEGMNDTY